MPENILKIRRAAVLGAGVMGAQIAAHLTNAGISTILFDLAQDKGDPNAIVNSSIKALTQLKPAPLATKGIEAFIIPANYEHDLAKLSQCDLIIEAISEQFEFKEKLYKKIIPYVDKHAIIATNTSGLSIHQLAQIFPSELKSRFLGIHFFNPPRYMKLVEVIPQESTDIDLLSKIEAFITIRLGKGVVYAKDTPNFIANRIGVFSLLSTLHHSQAFGISPDRVDNLTGPLIGRAKSATFRTMDIVGLDTMSHVINTLKNTLPDDPFAFLFETPPWIAHLISIGALGQKTKKGIYKKEASIMVWDQHDKAYRPMNGQIDNQVLQILNEPNVTLRFEKMAQSSLADLKFLWAIYRDLFHYCALTVESIAHTVQDIDLSMRWGYGWRSGPFEIWQSGNFQAIAKMIQNDIDAGKSLVKTPLPKWVFEAKNPYEKGQSLAPKENKYFTTHHLPIYQRQFSREHVLTASVEEGHTILENNAIRLWCLNDNIPILSFKTKRSTISMDVLLGIQEAIKRCERDYDALVIWQRQGEDFSLGANLKEVVEKVTSNQYEYLDKFIREFQNTAQALRYAQIPTVVAISGLTLGGGCELSMHATKRVAAFETYMGLVEVGVGIIPAGGGSKELALRASVDGFNTLKRYYEQVAMAQTSTSALDAKAMGYLNESDIVVYNTEELLYIARKQALALADPAYFPPQAKLFSVCGKTGIANIQSQLVNLREGAFISAHDYEVCLRLAHVMCGGHVEAQSLVSENWILDLEREAILELAKMPKTLERIKYTLETGKPLRN